MNVLFRCDSSENIGLGHLMRDLVLAKKLKGRIFFASRELKGNANHKIKESGFIYVPLKDESFETFKKVILDCHIDIVIFDHYGIDASFEERVKKTGVKTVSFDDTYKKHGSDLVINPNFGANLKRYPQKAISLAPLIRDEFFDVKKRKRVGIKKVFISFGGSDPKNLALKTLKVFQNKKYDISLVITSSNKNKTLLKRYARKHKNIKLYMDYPKIAKLFYENDFAVVSASTISSEALVSGIPFVAVMSVDNQKEVFGFLKRKRFYVLKDVNRIEITEKRYKELLKRVEIFRIKRGEIDLFKELS